MSIPRLCYRRQVMLRSSVRTVQWKRLPSAFWGLTMRWVLQVLGGRGFFAWGVVWDNLLWDNFQTSYGRRTGFSK